LVDTDAHSPAETDAEGKGFLILGVIGLVFARADGGG